MNETNILARGISGTITKCSCGTVNINLSGITIHLNENQFLNIARVISDASDKLINSELNKLFKKNN